MDQPQAQVKLEMLEAMAQVKVEAQVKAEGLCPPHGPPYAHGDAAVSSLAGLALPTPRTAGPVDPGSATPAAGAPAAAAAPKRSRPVRPRKSDYLGMASPKGSHQWHARIRHNGKDHQLGQFDDEQRPQGPTTRQRGGCGRKARPMAGDQAHTGTA